MSLPAGHRLNAYDIVSLVGAGGMGEVYRARDTRLNRDVALKVLPAQMAGDAAAFARFEREAQAVAALSHPNILSVFDVGESGSTRYVVFELLDGMSLRQRLEGGALPVRKAIDYARQIADGLAAAHARQITHRDIKPDNVFVTADGRVKILDFGLARTEPLPGASDAVTGATTAPPITDAGTVLGTVGYMAPEQVRGQPVDHRADIFALGATLYEMCTGRRAFKGATPADTMSAVLTADPPELTLSGQPTPPALDRIVRRCLEKQPAERFQSARDLAFALDALSALSGPGPQPGDAASAPRRTTMLPAAAAAVVALAAGLGLGRVVWPAQRPSGGGIAAPAIRTEFESSLRSLRSMAAIELELSPDGRRLAYSDTASGSGSRHIVVRDLSTGATTPVEGSEGAVLGPWSSAGDALIVVLQNREMRRFDVANRTLTLLATLPEEFRGAAWLDDGSIVVGMPGVEPLRRFSPASGEWTTVVRSDTEVLTRPRRLGPRSDYVLALRGSRGARTNPHLVTVRVADGLITPLIESMSGAAVGSGHLLVPRVSGLFAVPLDGDRLQASGDGVRLGDNVVWDPPNGVTSIAVSDTGVLAFRPAGIRAVQFEWLDATGTSLGPVGPPDLYGAFSLSPDGTRIVVRIQPSQAHPRGALRLIDITRGVASPIVTPEGLVSDPVWTPDGARVVYRLDDTLVRQSPFSSAVETVRNEMWFPDALSADGRWLLAGRPETIGGFGLFVLPGAGPGEPRPFDVGAISDEASFSPDGRLVSYHSTRTGRAEVYLTTFPASGDRWQVSNAGGVQPRWSADGRWLYYVDLTGTLQRVAIAAATPERIGRPETVMDLGIGPPSNTIEQWALHGDRVLAVRPAKDAPPESVVVVANWTSLLPAAAR